MLLPCFSGSNTVPLTSRFSFEQKGCFCWHSGYVTMSNNSWWGLGDLAAILLRYSGFGSSKLTLWCTWPRFPFCCNAWAVKRNSNDRRSPLMSEDMRTAVIAARDKQREGEEEKPLERKVKNCEKTVMRSRERGGERKRTCQIRAVKSFPFASCAMNF